MHRLGVQAKERVVCVAYGDLLVVGRITVTVYCSFGQTTCFWLALTIGTVTSDVLRAVLPLHTKPRIRLIISRSAAVCMAVYETATPFGVLIWPR